MAALTLAPNSTWFSQGGTSVTRASITEINIVDSYIPTGRETASWDASADKDGSVMCYVNGTKLTLAGNGSGKIYANADSSKLFYNTATDNFGSLTHISGLDVLDTRNVTTLLGAFARCASLTSLDLSSWDVSNVTTLAATFQYCISLETVDLTGWNTSKVTNIQTLFCSTDAVGEMRLKNILGIGDWDVSHVTNLGGAFQYCTNITALDLGKWNTAACTNMSTLFDSCYSLQTLDLSNWDTTSCTNMSNMLRSVRRLRKITLGSKFSFIGGVTLPTPASGAWYSTKTAAALAPSEIPSNTACTYVTYAPAVLAPNSTWFAPSDTSVTRAGITRIDIVDSYAPTGKETASWDASVSKNGSVMCYVNGGVLTMAGNGSGEIWANASSEHIFSDSTKTAYFSALTSISGTNVLNTQNVTTLRQAFRECKSLPSLDLSNWDVSNVTTLGSIFQHCIALETVNLTGWDTANVESISSMFLTTGTHGYMAVKNIIGIEKFDTRKVKDMTGVFQRCSSLENLDLSGWDTSSCESMPSMFASCTNLQKLNLSGWDTQNVANMTAMLSDMPKLRKITLGDKFSFTGNGSTSCTLPTPDPTYIRGADGNWYDRTGKAYAPSAIPSKTAGTYYASVEMLDGMSVVEKYLMSRMFPHLKRYFWNQ